MRSRPSRCSRQTAIGTGSTTWACAHKRAAVAQCRNTR
jgi:hypothetical protein